MKKSPSTQSISENLDFAIIKAHAFAEPRVPVSFSVATLKILLNRTKGFETAAGAIEVTFGKVRSYGQQLRGLSPMPRC